ncbi:hypothetical protein [Xanthobacter flavus]|uniref:hypothetical protein n=1 Tax=Xanthobacter flavus TaxID=281 RepID=UPI00372BCE3C
MTNDGGSAFPISPPVDETGRTAVGYPYPEAGMTLRDWFAGQIAAGMAAHSGTSGVSFGPHDIAGRSYQVADALLKAREEPHGE